MKPFGIWRHVFTSFAVPEAAVERDSTGSGFASFVALTETENTFPALAFLGAARLAFSTGLAPG